MNLLRRYPPILTWGAEYSRKTFTNDLIVAAIVNKTMVPNLGHINPSRRTTRLRGATGNRRGRLTFFADGSDVSGNEGTGYK
jgi:hypothetical protein